MNSKKSEDLNRITLEQLEKNPWFVMQAVEWLANNLAMVKMLTNCPEPLSTEAYRQELRHAAATQDPAYFALLWIQQLRSLTKE